MGLLNGFKAIKDTVKKQISKEFLDAAKKGEFLIPQTYLEAALRHALKNEEGVEVETVNFHAQGITLNLAIKQLGSSLSCSLLIKASKLKLSGNQQQVLVSIITQKVLGSNFLGKVATGLAGGIIDRILTDKIKDQEIVSHITTKDQQTDIEIDLSTLAPIQKLNQPLPLLGKSPLDLITIKSVHHVPGGLMLKLEQSVFLKRVYVKK